MGVLMKLIYQNWTKIISEIKKSFPYLLLLMVVSNVFYFVMKRIHSIFEEKVVELEPDLEDLPKIEEEDIIGI